MTDNSRHEPHLKGLAGAGHACRLCQAPLRHTFVDLGMSPLCESFLTAAQRDAMEPYYPLHVLLCDQCFLVQLREYHGQRMGMHQVIKPDGLYASQTRFGMFRWHTDDAVSFKKRLAVTVQDLGWMPDGRYLVRKDDIASTAFWYATVPQASGSTGLVYETMLVASRP